MSEEDEKLDISSRLQKAKRELRPTQGGLTLVSGEFEKRFKPNKNVTIQVIPHAKHPEHGTQNFRVEVQAPSDVHVHFGDNPEYDLEPGKRPAWQTKEGEMKVASLTTGDPEKLVQSLVAQLQSLGYEERLPVRSANRNNSERTL